VYTEDEILQNKKKTRKLITIIVSSIIFIGLSVYGLLVFFGRDVVVATINGVDIMATDVSAKLPFIENNLILEYFSIFDTQESLDENRIFRDNLTFRRVVREDAARLAARDILLLNFATDLNIRATEEEIEIIEKYIDELEKQMGGARELYHSLHYNGVRNRNHLSRILQFERHIFPGLLVFLHENHEYFERFIDYIPKETNYFLEISPIDIIRNAVHKAFEEKVANGELIFVGNRINNVELLPHTH